ncbi:alpha/beta hydrolase [Tritonibacter mobilis]|uniref:alpha/beta hydrolase n=1 Tax=Tritonibacter mobilis TaxID=379347 RepID=UPI003A5C0A2A
MKPRVFIAAALCAALLGAFVFWRLLDHDLERRAQTTFEFRTLEGQIAGTLWLPDEPLRAAVVLVHGDGAQDRTASGGYAPFINALLDRGIAVAAWDKPGIGASEGDWQQQSMQDRALEVRVALAQLEAAIAEVPIGALGFSQAGWVLPKLEPGAADFLVLVGPAVSWQAQGAYHTRVRFERAGYTRAAIAQALEASAAQDKTLFAHDIPPSPLPAGMTPARWGFIQVNRNSDASADLAALELPLMAIWGAQDLNVDAVRDFDRYRSLRAAAAAETKLQLWPEATHGLLRAKTYNYQSFDEWSWFAHARFVLAGRGAYAPGALDAISDWILAKSS